MGWATRNLEALLAHCAGTTDRVLRDELAGLVTHWFGAIRQMERVLAAAGRRRAPGRRGRR